MGDKREPGNRFSSDQLREFQERGWLVIDDFLPCSQADGLLKASQESDSQLRPAKIHDGLKSQIRSDKIFWWEEPLPPAQLLYWQTMMSLKDELNREFFLGLDYYECHFALYEPGARYEKHRDTSKGPKSRVVSSVYYLNKDWSATDGGELAIENLKILPVFNRFVVFLSEMHEHEVLPSKRFRRSVTGWFHVRKI